MGVCVAEGRSGAEGVAQWDEVEVELTRHGVVPSPAISVMVLDILFENILRLTSMWLATSISEVMKGG